MSNTLKEVSIACKRLITMEPFYGLFAIGLNRTVSETRVPTAGVGKRSISAELIVNPNFWAPLTMEQRIGLMKHELMHIAFNHIVTRKDYADHDLFNIAADLEINQYIDPAYHPPHPLLLKNYELEAYPRKGTKWYYEKLRDDLQKGKNPNLQKLYQAMQDGKTVICTHGTWDDFDNMSDAEVQVMKSHIEAQIKDLVSAGKLQGNIPQELKGWVEGLLMDVPPVIDWRSVFRRQVGGSTEVFTKKTRRKNSKRLDGNPGLKIKTKPLGAIYWDQSGSVSESEHKRFFTEVNHMRKGGLNFDIVPFNAEVLKPYRYRGESKYTVCGGGTAFTPVAEHFNKHCRNYAYGVILTDGHAEKPPRFKKPMIWVVTPDEQHGKPLKEMADWPGIKIKMNKDD